MLIFQQYERIWYSLLALPSRAAAFAFAVALLVSVLTVLTHEVSHWGAARCFGVTGRINFFASRGTSPVWFLSILGVDFKDDEFLALSRARRRLVAACGPLSEVAVSLSCFLGGLSLPGPLWASVGVALGGMLYLPCTLMNIVPMPFGNDGWRVLHP